MGDTYTALEKAERRVLFGLWCIPGVGPVGLGELRDGIALPELLTLPLGEWSGLPGAGPLAARFLQAEGYPSISDFAVAAYRHALSLGMSVCFRTDAAYPQLLWDVAEAPPVLFYRGRGPTSGRRTIALVGSRDVPASEKGHITGFAAQVAGAGVVIVSGAATGVDEACHAGALEVGGETWAFLGSALDQIDPAQRRITAAILEGNGTVFSEFPPGARANRQTFPRRNRLISGSSEATVIVRARQGSGALHTADYAQAQGRRLFVLTAAPWDDGAAGGLERLGKGASVCWSAESLLTAMEISGYSKPGFEAPDLTGLSPVARQTYEAMTRRPQVFEEVQGATGVDAGTLVSALCELELLGLVVQHPGKLYERI